MKQMKNCYICNADLQNETIYLNKFNHKLFENKSISICMECGFGQINTKLDQNDLKDYYENIYRNINSPMHINFNSSYLDINMLDFRSISQLLLGRQYMCSKKAYHFLDIGAGEGLSFISARKIFKNISLSVIESNSAAKNYYKKHFDDISIYKNLNEIKDKIDVLLMSHSLEHFCINDTHILFQDIHNVLADDGIVIIEVPHADLRNSNYHKERLNDTPHLSFFSLESISKLIDKSKFDLCFINTTGSLLMDKYSKKGSIEKKQNFIISRNSFGINRILKDSIKKVSKYVGLLGCLYKINAILKTTEYSYNNINFQYGGNRDCIRFVLKKK